jgi:hypothetical protein
MATDASVPPPESAATALQEAAHEQDFWNANAEALARRYPDQFVAVVDGDVAATGVDLDDLQRALAQKGLDLRRAWVRFLSSDPRRFVL